ncbi:MAG: hypothetical protein IT518_08145 [Burkholderiales bacterium]|nr:hypothetical protein [Burkholderiales bacterium]
MTARAARSLAAACLALLAAAAAAQDNSDIAVRAVKDGQTIRVEVDAPIKAPRAIAWEVLTDYDNMAKFVSNLQQSIIRMKMGNRLQVYQKGRASRGPLSLSFENLREIELAPQTEVKSKIISGDTMPATFSTRIEDRDGQLHIRHTGQYTPSVWVPPVIGTMLIEAEIRKQYGEIRDEILRRATGAPR